MKKYLLASVVFVAMTGAAFAQSNQTTTTTQSTSSPFGQEGVTVKRSEKSINNDGSQTEKSTTYESTSSPFPRDDKVKVKRTHKTTDLEGNEVERSKTIERNGADTSVTTKSRAKSADGFEATRQTQTTTTPEQ